MTVAEIGSKLRKREISCVELVKQTLADIEKRDVFRSFITITADEALEEAKERDAEFASGQDRGPFHGVPIAYKDLFYTRGVRTTAGSLIYRDFVPDHDAEAVKRFKKAGAISIGKTNLHELAYGITSKNPHYGFVLNPHDTSRIPGGSSGGSGTVIAANFVPVALGTDTGGSIRIPASYCGVVGLKPTYGRVSRRGVLPLAFSLDHVGPLGSCVEDCALAMNEMAASTEDFNLRELSNRLLGSRTTAPDACALSGMRVGVPKNFFFERVDGQVDAAVRKSISLMQGLGAELLEMQVPDLNEANAAARVIQYCESTSVYARYTDRSLFGEDVWALLEQGRLIAGHEYVSAQRIRSLFRREFDALWHKIDVLVTPTAPITAPKIEETTVQINGAAEDARMASTQLVRSINFLGEPAISIPCGKNRDGMPIGLQLIGAPFSEPKLLQIAKTLERALL